MIATARMFVSRRWIIADCRRNRAREAGIPRAESDDMAPHPSTLVNLGIPALALLVVMSIGLAVYRTAGGRDARRYALGAVGG